MIRLSLFAALLLATPVQALAQSSQATELAIVGPITPETGEAFVNSLYESRNSDGPVTVYINSPGGSMPVALAMSQALELTAQTRQVTCLIDGSAISAAFFILQSCQTRLATARSMLMAHEPWVGSEGAVTRQDAENTAAALTAFIHQLAEQCAARMKMSAKEFERRIHNREWWMNPEEALKVGAIDGIVPSPNSVLHASAAQSN